MVGELQRPCDNIPAFLLPPQNVKDNEDDVFEHILSHTATQLHDQPDNGDAKGNNDGTPFETYSVWNKPDGVISAESDDEVGTKGDNYVVDFQQRYIISSSPLKKLSYSSLTICFLTILFCIYIYR